ncbi:UbiA family prenyltransferase [Hymenobacter tibetensis]|uniref:UbiA family prenyltransferase n=1 Tax=Hymenobacter tibetensis TaxID=497967 RepID=A0ABY4CXI1_9BACT|nr:UbiA family prenyltransferase [Hymenobacter tibetensis]UOG74863.1 UbiA family prenyltransferase [Hymenobacter tibetensis]
MNLRHFAAYLGQRFPPVNMGLFAILFLTVWSVAGTAGAKVGFSWREAGGILATISFFFRLRVFDEIKDYAADAINHPHRVLQSGRVTLKQLQVLAWLGAGGELAWSWYMGPVAVAGWLLALGYSLLMRYEFWVSEYLKKRLVLYALTHMLIMPLLITWLWVAYRPELVLPARFFMLAALSLLGGFAFEIARKIRAPEAERAGVDSYSRAMGYRGAIGAVLLVLAGGIAVQSTLLVQLQAGVWPFGLLAGLFVLTLFVYLWAAAAPQEKLLRTAELLVSLFMLTSYVAIIVEIAV